MDSADEKLVLRSSYYPAPVDQTHPAGSNPGVQSSLEVLGRELELTPDVCLELLDAYLPICGEIDRHRRELARPMVVAVSGAQGSGKTTLCSFARALLVELHGWRVCGFSIDDFYLGREQRRDLSRRFHPLLETRGVPGTHDVAMGLDVLTRLLASGHEEVVTMPRFDKALDDRVPRDRWASFEGPVDVVIFEGWCVGARPQPHDELGAPINALEADEDPDALWRRYVNDQLNSRYAEWFGHIDMLIYLRVPDFENVREWRTLQEEKLARRRPGAVGLMDAAALDRFLMFYERTTRHALATLPDVADIVCHLDARHRIARIDSRKPLRW